MKTIYYVFTDDFGEVGGMYDSDGTLLDMWSCNDASWRGEYFNPFMKALGILVKPGSQKLTKKFAKHVEKEWG